MFTCCKAISNDTPLEYHSLDDLLQVSPVTAGMMPKFLRKGFRDNTVMRLIESVTDREWSNLIGGPSYKQGHESICEGSHTIIWISERSPNELAYVKGIASTDSEFPTTIKEASSSPY